MISLKDSSSRYQRLKSSTKIFSDLLKVSDYGSLLLTCQSCPKILGLYWRALIEALLKV